MRSTLILWLTVYCLGAAATLEPAAEFVHTDAAGKFNVLGQVAVVIAGDDQFVSHIMEDVLAVNLLSQDIKGGLPEANGSGQVACAGRPHADCAEGRCERAHNWDGAYRTCLY